LANDVIEFFRDKLEGPGSGYQAMVDHALHAVVLPDGPPAELLRKEPRAA
jgi:hypothetical protein